MSNAPNKLGGFWRAEEIPRSLGLMLVCVFVAGLGAMALASQRYAERSARDAILEAREEAFIALVGAVKATETLDGPQLNPVLHRFARWLPCATLRVYNERGRILASLSAHEVGQPLPPHDPELPPSSATAPVSSIMDIDGRKQLITRMSLQGTGDSKDVVVEAVFELPASLSAGGLPVVGLLIALVTAVALLGVYRLMRKHFRSFARIVEALQSRNGDLGGSLRELQMADARDEVANSWNQLVEFAINLEEEVARSNASSDLLAALSKNNSGELAEAMVSVPIGVVLVADNASITYANSMARRMMGWPRESDDVLALDDTAVSASGKPIADFVSHCLAQPDSLRIQDRQIEVGDGSFYHIQVVPVRSPQRARRYVVLMVDISQQVRADKAREDFVSQVTHELRTPLTNIRAYAETLSSGMFDDPQVITECYNVITKETRRLGRLIEDILSISQLEVGTMQLVFDDVDLTALLTEAVRDVRGIAEAKNIDLQIDLPPKLDPLRADRDKLAVVLNNLLGNAVKYTREGGQVALTCKVAESELCIAVRDSGIGIDPKDHSRVFEKFQRADDEEVRNETGTGIGLTTAREIVEHHGGTISLVSTKGEGSTFTVQLPVEKRAPALSEGQV